MITMFKRTNNFKIRALLISASGLLITACSFTETPRVDADFGRSVRNMIAEQIYDPEAAQSPSTEIPTGDGTSAANGVSGYQQAGAEARVERSEQDASPIPVVGIASGPGQ